MHALLILLLLACGAGEPPGPELPEPWATTFTAPAGGGTLKEASARSLVVTYAEGDPAAIGKRWAAALQEAGFTVSPPMRLRNVLLSEVSRDGQSLTLGVAQKSGAVEVHLTVDDEE